MPISPGWQRWIAENLMLRVDPQVLVDTLVRNGTDQETGLAELRAATGHPYVQAGEQLVQLSKKLESILNVYRDLAGLLPTGRAIDRRETLSRDEFLRGYYAANRPVVLTNIMQNWKALALWTPEYLRERYGDIEVQVMAGRDADPKYEQNLDVHKTLMPFGQYIDRVLTLGESNDVYMVANNHNLERPEFRPLLDDLEIFPEWLDPARAERSIFLWMGGAGTVTPLHHDAMNVLLAQVRGCKRIRMFPPTETPRLYNYMGVFSDVDCENPDLRQHGLFQQAISIEMVLQPGEALFIPVGWWHHVRSLDVSISVSFVNFRFPNQYHWNDPHIRR